MSDITSILKKQSFDRTDITSLLSISDSEPLEELRCAAEKMLLDRRGDNVYFRGLVEFSNICSSDCNYCGIRKSNNHVNRYMLKKEQIVNSAVWCAEQGYGSVVLQSGERRDPAFIDFIEDVIADIKTHTISDIMPKGIGITLCVGEQLTETYKRFFDAGAHRYLLRIETTSPTLFKSLHPEEQTFEARVECLKSLKEIGFLVGTGVMIGLPGQTIEMLADDVLYLTPVSPPLRRSTKA
jgi:biotin synthase